MLAELQALSPNAAHYVNVFMQQLWFMLLRIRGRLAREARAPNYRRDFVRFKRRRLYHTDDDTADLGYVPGDTRRVRGRP